MINIQQNTPLAPFTTFRIGGPAKFFIEVKTKGEIMEAMEWAEKNNEQVFILAGGSNVLINDKGVNGLVIKIRDARCEIRDTRLECGAGMPLAQAVKVAAENNLAGLEWAIAIPGTIGGAVAGNAGAYGCSMGELVESAEIFKRASNGKWEFKKISGNDFAFGYKKSIFSAIDAGIIWQVTLKLKKGNKEEIDGLMKKYLEHRGKSQPKLSSAGCIFKNVSIMNLREWNANLANKAEEERVIRNEMVGAGWIIDRLGLKGKAIGGAKISQDHANFIVNGQKATAEDVITLISFIKQQARDRLKIQLQEEIQYLGF